MKQLIIGLCAEGPTDKRYLPEIISRVYRELSLDCRSMIDLPPIQIINIARQDLPDYMVQAMWIGWTSYGTDIVCVHADADSRSDKKIHSEKIDLGLDNIARMKEEKGIKCMLVPIVPVRTIENWMLADPEAIASQIGCHIDQVNALLLHPAESYSNPKSHLKSIIRECSSRRGRRSHIDLSELYQPLGEFSRLDQLMKLPSFRKFYEAARLSLVELGLMHP